MIDIELLFLAENLFIMLNFSLIITFIYFCEFFNEIELFFSFSKCCDDFVFI